MRDIAVVIPTHNRARLLPAALDSILAQTAPVRLEVAVVDDGSTDDTSAVVRPYLDRHADPAGKVLVRYQRLDKQGVVAARNWAIARTSAPWVAFLDSDDYWDRRKLERQAAAMADPAVGVCHTSFRYVDDAGTFQDPGPQRPDNPCAGDCWNALLDEDLVIFSSVLMRRSVIERIAAEAAHGLPFDPRWTNAQDYDLLLRAAVVSRFAYVPEPLTLYRRHHGHAAMGNLPRAFGFHSRVQIDFVARFGARLGLGPDEGRRRAAAFLYRRAESLFWQRHLATARRLCELARELGVSDARFESLARRTRRPAWLYRAKDWLDRARGR